MCAIGITGCTTTDSYTVWGAWNVGRIFILMEAHMGHGCCRGAGLGMSIFFLVHHCSDQLFQLVNTIVDTVRSFGILCRRRFTDVRARKRKTSIDACFAWLLPVTFQLSPTAERARHNRFVSPTAWRYHTLQMSVCVHFEG
jgi:hypothetical protein